MTSAASGGRGGATGRGGGATGHGDVGGHGGDDGRTASAVSTVSVECTRLF